MQDFAFGLGYFLEWSFKILEKLGWLPVALIGITLFVGMVYWLRLQGKYDRTAKSNGTLA